MSSRNCSSLLLLLALSVPAAAKPWQVEVRTSLPESVFYLMECLVPKPGHSTLLPAAFDAGHPAAEQAAALASFRRFSHAADLSDDLPGGHALDQVLERMAVDSSDVPDFLRHTRALLDEAEQLDLAAALRYYEGAYRDTLWRAAQPELLRQQATVQERIEQSAMSQWIAAAAQLIGSNWAPEDPFQIVLVPVSARAAHGASSYGHSVGYLQVVELLDGERVGHRMGVFFHEVVHSLWATQSREVRARLRTGFTGLEGQLAWQELNEGMATVLGNGLFQEHLDGQLPPRPWYADDTIDGYAAALLPLVRGRKQLDETFAREAQAAFMEAFPRATTDPRLLLRHVNADTPPATHLSGFVAAHTRLSSWTNGAAALHLVCTPVPSHGAPTGRTGVWCRRDEDHWTAVCVGPDESAWQAELLQFMHQPRVVEGWQPG